MRVHIWKITILPTDCRDLFEQTRYFIMNWLKFSATIKIGLKCEDWEFDSYFLWMQLAIANNSSFIEVFFFVEIYTQNHIMCMNYLPLSVSKKNSIHLIGVNLKRKLYVVYFRSIDRYSWWFKYFSCEKRWVIPYWDIIIRKKGRLNRFIGLIAVSKFAFLIIQFVQYLNFGIIVDSEIQKSIEIK